MKPGPSDTPHAEYRFGDYLLRTCPYELQLEGEGVPLQPQAARLLDLLVRQAPAPVTRGEIRDGLWRAGTHVDFDQAINFLIRTLRRTLNDDPRQPTYIETVPRVGYRFVAAVEETHPPSRAGRPRARASRATLVGLSVALVLVAIALTLRKQELPSPGREASQEVREGLQIDRGAFESQDPITRRRRLAELERAVRLEPGLVEAMEELAEGYSALRRWREAEDWAKRALARDPYSSAAHASMAKVSIASHLDLVAADRHYAVAASAESVASDTLVEYSVYLSAMGRHREALETVMRAVRSSSASQDLQIRVARCHFYARDYSAAANEANEILSRTEKNGAAQSLLTDILVLQGEDGAALAQMNRFLGAWGWDAFEEARVFWERAASNGVGFSPIGRAWVNLNLGERALALEQLHEAACGDHPQPLDLLLLRVDPRLDALRSEPGFGEVLSCLGLAGDRSSLAAQSSGC